MITQLLSALDIYPIVDTDISEMDFTHDDVNEGDFVSQDQDKSTRVP